MKKVSLVVFGLVVIASLVCAQVATSDAIAVLKENHKKAMQNFGHLYAWNEANVSYSVSGRNLISVVRGKEEFFLYTEDSNRKLYTILTITAGEKPGQINVNFECKVTIGNSTYEIKYVYTFDFSSTPSCSAKAITQTRWEWEKCWECLECAAGNINELYNAYQECQLDWQCWITKFPQLVKLYECVMNSCVPCFSDRK